MRNLRNIRHAVIDLGEDSTSLTAATWDSTGLICGFGPDGENSTVVLKRFPAAASASDDGISIASWDAPSPNPDLSQDRILDIHSFPDTGSICLILEGGDIITVREGDESGPSSVEIVGSVDAGIVAASWSPDEELLAIATKAQTLLLMTRDFEGTTDITFSSDDLKVSNHVSVGWGKSETQFKGRGAKALRDPTVPEKVDEGRMNSSDDERTTISWRGDGQFVAVNGILDTAPRRRVIRVYSREGQLDSVSEPLDGLEGALSWKPSGQIIAGLRRQPNQAEVVFFERNGLRHGSFPLRLDSIENVSLQWSVDSSTLAVCTTGRVQFWTMSNYHYYLKQEVVLRHTEREAVNVVWHPESALQVACFSPRDLRLLRYNFEVAKGSVRPPHDQGLVAVIDGKQLRVTPLRIANVPPPMAMDELSLPSNAVDVAVSSDGSRLMVLHSDCISTWRCNYKLNAFKAAELERVIPLVISGFPSAPVFRQIAFDAQDQPIVTASVTNVAASALTWPLDSSAELVYNPENVTTTFHGANNDELFCLDSSGAIFGMKGTTPGDCLGKLQMTSTMAEVWNQDERHILFGLSPGGLLQIHDSEQTFKISGCTSFVVTPSHLVFTTSQHLLKFVHLHAGKLEIPADEPEKDERCRSIERGARLITVIPSTFSLILQMPRGNLETIYPRALVLAAIRQAVHDRHYHEAFRICRTQRVDMNILHDHAPGQFMNDVGLFIKQVKRVDFIDLFLSSLAEEDVAKTIYKETLKVPVEHSNEERDVTVASSKVNRVCDAFLQALSSHSSSYLQCIVTAHVCKNPPDLEAGLSLVSKLRKENDVENLEQAIEHICFLADVNKLYETALGLYDLDVALLVAQQSQKDPREYLPYMQKLHELEPLRQRFSIDNDLKRYTKALAHLHAAGNFEELKSYATKHELLNDALNLYRYDKLRLEELMRLNAEYLVSRNRFKEAGIAYEYISDYFTAHEAYRAAGLWRECIACAAFHGISDSKLTELARDLAESLEESKDFVAAATIYLDHIHDIESGIRLLCRGYHFSDAIRHVALQRRPELLDSVVDSGLIEASATLTEMLAEMRSQLAAQVPRLRDLRRKKAEDPMSFLDGGDGENDIDIPDNISLAQTDASTSGGTFLTRYTNRSTGTLATNATRKTSKNRRREERKRAKGKKGTVYEEEYLVNSISRLIQRLNETGEDTGRLIEGLMRRGMRERAVAVNDASQGVVDACRECMDEVFAPSTEMDEHRTESDSVPRPFGGQGVLWEAIAASQRQREVPVLKDLERLSLLG